MNTFAVIVAPNIDNKGWFNVNIVPVTPQGEELPKIDYQIFTGYTEAKEFASAVYYGLTITERAAYIAY